MRKIRRSFGGGRIPGLLLGLIMFVCVGGLGTLLLLRPTVQAAPNDQEPGTPSNATRSAVSVSSTAPAENPLRHTATIELVNGELDVGELLGHLADASGLDGRRVRENVNWKVDVNSPAGRVTLAGIQHFTRGVVTFDLREDRLDLTFDQLRLRNEEKQIRHAVLLFLKRIAPEAAAKVEARYGFVVHREDGSTVSPSVANLNGNAVVLVHGLDDPGKVWNVLAPTLVKKGYTTCEFFYPNDQAIDSSAELFIEHLATLRKLGVRRITIVAHSMGGLVARWALTDSDGYGGQVCGQDDLPDVQRLIMVGTPNHGSTMARFRLAAEIREQVERLLSGDGMLFGSVFDGTGEAKIDLLPDSTFLTTLNARPNPPDLPVTIIAGNTSPVTAKQLERLKPLIREEIGPQASQPAGAILDSLAEVAEGMGDGVVSLESARLDGVQDFVIVGANHLTMIRNYSRTSERIPPAVPLILKRLENGD